MELSNIPGIIEFDVGGERADKLRNKSVKVGVRKIFIIEISSADIVDGFIIKRKRNISIL